MAPKRRCPVCQSRKWHKEPSSGLIVCSEGHVMQNYRNEAIDAEEMGPHALKKRALKREKRTTGKGSRADPKLYHGARAQYHYFQCQQLILRHQVAALIREWSLPPEFEGICRDIWALHLSLLPNPPPAEPYFHSQDLLETTDKVKNSQFEAKQRSNQTGVFPASPSASLASDDGAKGMDIVHSEDYALHRENDDMNGESEQIDEVGNDEEDPELAALLHENSESSSTSGDEESDRLHGDTVEGGETEKKRGGARKRHTYEGLQSTLSVLVIGLWILRVPFLYCDIIRLIEAYKVPYLDALRLLPRNMTIHLTKYNFQSLTPAHAPQTLVLHALVSRLAKRLNSVYKVFTPEVNAGPLLWRVVTGLAGTPMLYILTKRLGNVLSLPLTLHHSLSPELERLTKSHPESHKYDNVPPELALAATAVIVFKMAYGLDAQRRVPRDCNDPASWLPKPEEFIAALRMMNTIDAERKENILAASSSMTVADLSTEMLDEYLEFCQRALLGRQADEKPGGEAVLNRFFPLTESHRTEGERSAIRLEYPRRDLHANLPSPSAHEGEQETLLPAEQYTIYHARDVFGSLGEDIELLVERVGKIVGVPVEYVLCVVENYERRVARWWKQSQRKLQEKRLRGGQEDELNIEDEYDDRTIMN